MCFEDDPFDLAQQLVCDSFRRTKAFYKLLREVLDTRRAVGAQHRRQIGRSTALVTPGQRDIGTHNVAMSSLQEGLVGRIIADKSGTRCDQVSEGSLTRAARTDDGHEPARQRDLWCRDPIRTRNCDSVDHSIRQSALRRALGNSRPLLWLEACLAQRLEGRIPLNPRVAVSVGCPDIRQLVGVATVKADLCAVVAFGELLNVGGTVAGPELALLGSPRKDDASKTLDLDTHRFQRVPAVAHTRRAVAGARRDCD